MTSHLSIYLNGETTKSVHLAVVQTLQFLVISFPSLLHHCSVEKEHRKGIHVAAKYPSNFSSVSGVQVNT